MGPAIGQSRKFGEIHSNPQSKKLSLKKVSRRSRTVLANALARISPGSDWFGPVQNICHSIREWCQLHGSPYAVLDEPHLFAGVLPGGRVYGKRAIGVISHRDELFSELSVFRSSWQKPTPPEEHRLFRQWLLPRARPLKGTAAVLASPGGGTYYHWMFETLPRLEMLRRMDFPPASLDHFVVNTRIHAFQRFTLNHFNISSRTVALDENPHLRADALIAPAMPGLSGEPGPWILDFLRSSFLGIAGKPIGATARKIYISRGKAKHRRMVNEEQVIHWLERFGFRSVCLEEISFAEQIALFRDAEAVVAVHGAGLANLVFCNPQAKVLEIFTPGLKPQMYAHIARQLGLTYEGLTPASAQAPSAPCKLRDVEVTREELEGALEKLNANAGQPMCNASAGT